MTSLLYKMLEFVGYLNHVALETPFYSKICHDVV